MWSSVQSRVPGKMKGEKERGKKGREGGEREGRKEKKNYRR
jgi:hypothetical protein